MRRVYLGAMYPGTNSTTVWSDPDCGEYYAFDSFRHLTLAAERAGMDFVFFAESLRLRERLGAVYDRDVTGRPDNFTLLAALAAITERIGLVATANTTFNEPYEVARQFATLDHLCAGRAGWNVVTSWERFVGENFRRGSYLPAERRYDRAAAFLSAACRLMESWSEGAVLADQAAGVFVRSAAIEHVAQHDEFFDIEGRFNVPRSPQGRPVIFQAGASEEGRQFAAESADAIFAMYASPEVTAAFTRDVKQRAARCGRHPDTLLSLPAATFALGDTDSEAREHANVVRRAQVDGATAIRFLEQLWNRDLSAYDPDGPLPECEPLLEPDGVASSLSSVRHYPDRLASARQWREMAAAGNLSIRDLIIEVLGRQTFIGTPATVAEQIIGQVQERVCDGFVIVPHLVPHGLDEFAERVVPLLRERGVLREWRTGSTFREHLDLHRSNLYA